MFKILLLILDEKIWDTFFIAVMLPCICINLARRNDRKRHMQKVLKSLKLKAKWVKAIDGALVFTKQSVVFGVCRKFFRMCIERMFFGNTFFW